MYDYLVVGSGLYGATFAQQAKAHGKSVLVIDKRPNIAGNIYTEKVEGINFHKYGAHIFHTNNKEVWDYLQQFTVFNRFTNSPVANYKGELYGFVDILNPRACYPSSKRAAETLCAAYKKEYGVDVVIIRPGHVYGPTMTDTDNRASSQFPRDVKAGKNIIMKSAGTQLRSYCYVLDCATAILTVLLNGESGEAYNVSNKNSVVTIREMAEAFAEVGGKKLIFEEATKAESASFNLMQNSSLTSEKIEALGWSAQFDMLSGARRTLNSMF